MNGAQPLFRVLCCCVAFLLAACNPAAVLDNNVKNAARSAAQLRFAKACGTLTIPDTAFLPVDITGGGHDYVLSFARTACANKPDLWWGREGSLFQLWIAENNSPRLVLEQYMDGFRQDRKSTLLVTDQRRSSCGATAADEICRVVYRWNPAARSLLIQEQHAPTEPLPVPGNIARGKTGLSASLSSQSHAFTKTR
jgi:hypothetical protein